MSLSNRYEVIKRQATEPKSSQTVPLPKNKRYLLTKTGESKAGNRNMREKSPEESP